MPTSDLRHLAVIAVPDGELAGDPGPAVLACCGHAAQTARQAFELVPGLQAFSWLCPTLDRLLARSPAPAAAAACAAGARALAAAADGLGAALRVCGKVDDLPGSPARAGRGTDGRTLLWFQRYSGRDEIVRAAGRFFQAHPGHVLSDDGLDAWLDTAGLPDPDLLVYAGGALEPRDALLWQGSYAEIWHTPEPGLPFSAANLRLAVADYHERQRRFGR